MFRSTFWKLTISPSIQKQLVFHLIAKVAFEAFGADHHVGFDFVAF
jgi:hypothetical protein